MTSSQSPTSVNLMLSPDQRRRLTQEVQTLARKSAEQAGSTGWFGRLDSLVGKGENLTIHALFFLVIAGAAALVYLTVNGQIASIAAGVGTFVGLAIVYCLIVRVLMAGARKIGLAESPSNPIPAASKLSPFAANWDHLERDWGNAVMHPDGGLEIPSAELTLRVGRVVPLPSGACLLCTEQDAASSKSIPILVSDQIATRFQPGE
ncbi:MAG: hypothetical protein QF471_08305 [Phycisphaerales bacterium]|jgi:hypothetical protein|nr:hypothetical protein [Phycisphaerales bacterium]